MKTPAAYWRMVYKADRRKHSHRCRACNRVVEPGTEVYMARLSNGKTKVIHVDCGENEVEPGVTQLQLLECHGMAYLAKCGFSPAQDWLDASPLTKTRPSAPIEKE